MGASQSELAEYVDEGPTVTPERILRIVKSVEKTEEVSIDDIINQRGSEKGDGFLSDIEDVKIVATVEGVKKEYMWMIKSTPREANRHIFSRKIFRADEREVKFFSHLLPKLRDFAKSKGKENLVANFCHVPFASWSELDKVLVMENLKTIGFRDAIDKKAGLDVQHIEMVLSWLASFHALSYAFIDQHQGGIEKIKEEFDIFYFKFLANESFKNLIDQFKGMTEMANMAQKTLMEQIGAVSGETKYVESWQKVIDTHGDIAMADMKVRDASVDGDMFKIKTFIHGDPWFNNMMFKYDESNNPKDLKMLDLQISSYLPPTMDLAYFLYSSTTGAVRKKNLTHFLRLYHDIFITNVNQFGSILEYTFDELVADFWKSALHGVAFAMGPLAQVLAEKEDIRDIGDFTQGLKDMDIESEEAKAYVKAEMDHMQNVMDKNVGYKIRVKDVWDECINNGAL